MLSKSLEAEQTPEQAMKVTLAKAGAGKVTCRLCKGDHFTAKCPYKDTLAGLDVTEQAEDGGGPSGDSPSPAPATSGGGGGGTGGKYVPPSMRAGAQAGVVTGSRSGSDLPTLRVTNVSEDTQVCLTDLFFITLLTIDGIHRNLTFVNSSPASVV